MVPNPTFLDLVKIWASEKKYGILTDRNDPPNWVDAFGGRARESRGWYLSIYSDGVVVGTTYVGPKQIAETRYHDELSPSDPKFFDSLEVIIAEMKLKCRH